MALTRQLALLLASLAALALVRALRGTDAHPRPAVHSAPPTVVVVEVAAGPAVTPDALDLPPGWQPIVAVDDAQLPVNNTYLVRDSNHVR